MNTLTMFHIKKNINMKGTGGWAARELFIDF